MVFHYVVVVVFTFVLLQIAITYIKLKRNSYFLLCDKILSLQIV